MSKKMIYRSSIIAAHSHKAKTRKKKIIIDLLSFSVIWKIVFKWCAIICYWVWEKKTIEQIDLWGDFKWQKLIFFTHKNINLKRFNCTRNSIFYLTFHISQSPTFQVKIYSLCLQPFKLWTHIRKRPVKGWQDTTFGMSLAIFRFRFSRLHTHTHLNSPNALSLL